jgi:DNA-directed RNA polymerase subunit RPC12/RpoP
MIIRNSIHAPVFKKKLSIEEIKERTVGEPFDLISTEYVNAHTKMEWLCQNCGKSFWSSWLNISFGWKCSNCKKIRTSKRVKEMRKSRGDGMDVSVARESVKEKGVLIVENISGYIGNLPTRVTRFLCVVCDKEFNGRVRDVLRKTGYGCWDCSRLRGESSPMWRGGKKTKYAKEWNETLRERIRERDGRKCQFPECETTDFTGKTKLHVHHINGAKEDCRDINLISLCGSHHVHIESTSPENWQDYFYSITADYEHREIA